MEIYKNIQAMLKSRGLTDYRVGRESDMTQEGVRLITHGVTKNPGVLTLMKIARVAGVTVSELIGEVAPPVEKMRRPFTMDDLCHCLDDLGISAERRRDIILIAEDAIKSKGSGKKR